MMRRIIISASTKLKSQRRAFTSAICFPLHNTNISRLNPAATAAATPRQQQRLLSFTFGNDDFFERAQLLIDSKKGSWTADEWDEAFEVLRYWKGDDIAWKLMDRTVLEESTIDNQGGDINSKLSMRTGLVSELVNGWKESPGTLSSLDIVQKLESYRHLAPTLSVNIKLYNVIIDHAIKAREEHVHDLAEFVIQSLTKGPPLDNPISRPNAQTFSLALYTLSKSTAPDAPQRADDLVEQMKMLTEDGWDDVEPDDTTYTNLIATWAASYSPGAEQRAEDLLFECPAPTTIRFQHVMKGWAKREDNASIDRCIELFTKLRNMYRSRYNPSLKPGAITYGIAISALAKKGRAREAQEILEELVNDYQRQHDPDLAPDRIHYNALIDAWAKSEERGAPEKAEALLETMHIMERDSNNKKMAPDVTSYTSVLHAWARSDEPMAVARAEAILQTMQKMGKSGGTSLKPNLLSYSSLLDCLAKTRTKVAADRAEAMLQLLITRSKAGEKDLTPDTITFNIVINAFANSRHPDGPIKAEEIYDRMKRFGVKPNSSTFNTLITAWTNCNDERAAEKAEKYLHEMKQLYLSGNESCKPTTPVYNSLISAWSTSNDPTAVQRARAILEEMKRMEADGQIECSPTFVTYTSLINVIAKSTEQDKAVLAFDLLSEMDNRSIQPTDRTYGSVLMACAFSRGYYRRTRERAFKIAATVIQRAHSSPSTAPSSQTYGFFFTAAIGMQEFRVIEVVYKWCREAGYGDDKRILKSLKIAAPHLVPNHSGGRNT